MGGLRINAIDANQSEECHGAKFEGKTKGNTDAKNGGHKSEDKPKSFSTTPMVGTAMIPMPVQTMVRTAHPVWTPYGLQMTQSMQPAMTQQMVPVQVQMQASSMVNQGSSQQKNPSSMVGNMESFFGGSFFSQKFESHMDQFGEMLP